MTTIEIVNYYVNLLIFQYYSGPNAEATVALDVAPIIMDQLPIQVQNAFCVGQQTINGVTYPGAVGTQLDVLGEYVGVSRTGYDTSGNPITLDDADFTALIQIGIVHNSAPSTLYNIDFLLNTYFPGEIFCFDNANMTMNYVITSSIGYQQLVELFVTEGLLPAPMGVEIASIVYISSLSLFGFQRYSGLAPSWSSTTTYNKGQPVYSSSAGITYQSAQSSNLDNALSNLTWWTPIIEPLLRYNSYSLAYLTDNTVFQFLRYDDTIDIPTS